MKIPLTLAIIPALTISSAGERYCIPQVSLSELVRLEGEAALRGIESIHGAPVYRLRGNLLPLVYLNQQLESGGSYPDVGGGALVGALPKDVINIVVLQADDRPFGLIVDGIHDTEEIVVKPLQKQLKGISIFAGVTILGDGRAALILDVLSLAQRAKVVSGVRERALSENPVGPTASNVDRQTVLLFATLDGGRMAIPLSLVDRLEEFPRSAIERTGIREVVQYRDEILPLVDLSRVIRRRNKTKRPTADRPPVPGPSDPVQVIVIAHNGRRVGMVVERILDIAEETQVSRSAAYRPGVLFTAVIQNRVTEFLDVGRVLTFVDSDLLGPAALSPAEA
jgi:two-component system chemotaxis sensor kinase CheA